MFRPRAPRPQKFLYWVDVEWAKPFSWDSPRGFVWAIMPTMVAVLMLAFAIDIYMIFSHTSQERKDKAKEAEKTAELAASGGKKDD